MQFYGQWFEGDAIMYVVDRSGSMTDSGELDVAKREVIRNVSDFSAQSEFAIVFFDKLVISWPPGEKPVKADAGPKTAARSWVMSLSGGGGSCVKSGLLKGLSYADHSSKSRKVLIYVGDGGGTCVGMEKDYHVLTLDRVRQVNHGVQINAIGVLMKGRVSQREFLQKLARNNGGTYTEIVR